MTNTCPPLRRLQARATLRLSVLLIACGVAGAPAQDPPDEAPDTLTGSWNVRAKLAERGVAPFAVWTAEAWANVAGGLQREGWWNSLLDFGATFDTAKLGWWEHGAFMVQAHWVQNRRNDVTFREFTGGFSPVSSVMAADHLRVFNLYYQHAWRGEAVVLKLGQIAADDDFMGSEYAGLFLNPAFGAMPSQVGTPLATSCGGCAAFPIYSVAAPGIFLRVQPADSFSSQLGLYYGRPGPDERANHGFDWANHSPPELGLFWENSYSYTLAARPATVRLGLSHHTGPVDDFSAGLLSDHTGTRQTVPNFYLIHDLELLAAGQGKPKLGLFARLGLTPEPDRSMVAAYADAGLNWFAPLPRRTHDVAGLALSYTRFGSEFRRATDPRGVATDETTLELTYKAQVTRWMAIQADAQFLFNPAVNPDSGSRETAAILGLRAQIQF